MASVSSEYLNVEAKLRATILARLVVFTDSNHLVIVTVDDESEVLIVI